MKNKVLLEAMNILLLKLEEQIEPENTEHYHKDTPYWLAYNEAIDTASNIVRDEITKLRDKYPAFKTPY